MPKQLDRNFATRFLTFQKTNDSPKSLSAVDRLIRNANLQHRLANVKDDAIKHYEVSFRLNLKTFAELSAT